MKRRLMRVFTNVRLPIFLLLLLCSTDTLSGIVKSGCCPEGQNCVQCNEPFTATKNGVEYDCTCNCSGSDNCTPRSQSGGSSSIGHQSHSQSTAEMFAKELTEQVMQNLINNLFSSPSSDQGKSPAQLQLEQEQLQRQQEQIRLQQEQRNKEIQEQWKTWKADRDKLASEMKGRPAPTEFFGQKGAPTPLDLKPIPTTSYRPSNSAWGQLNASNWLSEMAGEAAREGELVEASFLSDQAFKAANGGLLSVKVPSAPPPPESFNTPGNAEVYQGFVIAINQQTKKVVDATGELKKATEKRKAAEKEAVENEKHLEEIKSQPNADSGTSQEDPDLIAAMKALEQSKQNLIDAGQGEEKAKQQEEQQKKILTGLGSMYSDAQKNPNKFKP